MLGETIGHYRLTDRLGAGAMGEVYLAEDTRLHRPVELKMLPVDAGGKRNRHLERNASAPGTAGSRHGNPRLHVTRAGSRRRRGRAERRILARGPALRAPRRALLPPLLLDVLPNRLRVDLGSVDVALLVDRHSDVVTGSRFSFISVASFFVFGAGRFASPVGGITDFALWRQPRRAPTLTP